MRGVTIAFGLRACGGHRRLLWYQTSGLPLRALCDVTFFRATTFLRVDFSLSAVYVPPR